MARKRANLTDLLNELTFSTLYNKFRLLATSAFEWTGLPDGIEEKFIERFLFDYGKAAFFRAKKRNAREIPPRSSHRAFLLSIWICDLP